ncbi:MAG: TniQ family protein [Cyanobacteria bacterium P01_D01_bin.116]
MFSSIGLMRPHSAWCPICFEDWKQNNQPIYEPLIWKLKVINVCPSHQTLLQTKCQNCQKILPQLSSRSQPGYCSKCYQWLGIKKDDIHDIEFKCMPSCELAWQAFVAENIGELLARTPTLLSIPSREDVSQNLKKCIDLSTGGNRQAFAELICMTTSAVWGWYKGSSLPQILVLLRICYCLNISLIDFLNGNISLFDSNHINTLHPNQHSKISRHFPVEKTIILLSTYLESEPPISMEAVAQKLQRDKRILYRHFPSLCMRIASRYKKYRSELSRQRIENLCFKAKSAAIELASIGVYPSDAKVQAHLNWKGHMKNKQIRDYLTQVRLELGFDK